MPTRNRGLWIKLPRATTDKPFMLFGSKGHKGDRSGIPGMDVLDAACDRNLPLEIFRSSGPGAPPAARGRLIRLENDGLIMEHARNREGEVELRRGQDVDAFFSFRDEIYGFRTSVAEPKIMSSLNGRTKVQAIRLRLPDRVEVTQRRARFRVSLASVKPRIPVKLLFEEVIPVDGGRWSDFELIDASGLGVGVMTKSVLDLKTLQDRECFLRLKTPGTEEAFVLKGRVRRAFAIEAADSVRLGVQFLPWPSKGELEETLEPFEAYLMQVQRERMSKGVA